MVESKGRKGSGGAEGEEGRGVVGGQEVCGATRVMTDQGEAREMREPGGALGMTDHSEAGRVGARGSTHQGGVGDLEAQGS